MIHDTAGGSNGGGSPPPKPNSLGLGKVPVLQAYLARSGKCRNYLV